MNLNERSRIRETRKAWLFYFCFEWKDAEDQKENK